MLNIVNPLLQNEYSVDNKEIKLDYNYPKSDDRFIIIPFMYHMKWNGAVLYCREWEEKGRMQIVLDVIDTNENDGRCGLHVITPRGSNSIYGYAYWRYRYGNNRNLRVVNYFSHTAKYRVWNLVGLDYRNQGGVVFPYAWGDWSPDIWGINVKTTLNEARWINSIFRARFDREPRTTTLKELDVKNWGLHRAWENTQYTGPDVYPMYWERISN